MTENLRKSLENMDTVIQAFENLSKAFENMFNSMKEEELGKFLKENKDEIDDAIKKFSKCSKENIEKLQKEWNNGLNAD